MSWPHYHFKISHLQIENAQKGMYLTGSLHWGACEKFLASLGDLQRIPWPDYNIKPLKMYQLGRYDSFAIGSSTQSPICRHSLLLRQIRRNLPGTWKIGYVRLDVTILHKNCISSRRPLTPAHFHSSVEWALIITSIPGLRVIWGQCCPRVAAGPCLPNGPITQLRP